MNIMKRFLAISVPGLLLIFSASTAAQWNKKPPAEWSEKDATKVLNDSPWGRTQTFDSPEQQYRGPVTGRQGTGSRTSDAPPQAIHLFFRVRFLSAKPIRQALSRLIELKQKGELKPELAEQLKQFASGEFLEYIVVAVTSEAADVGANVQQAAAILRRDNAELKNTTYLEVKGGKRVYLQEFQPTRPDGFGARFIFLRLVDGKPFITPESEEIHFVAPISDTYRLDRRFKVKDMMYEGKLEY
jgi:hypothetical protein